MPLRPSIFKAAQRHSITVLPVRKANLKLEEYKLCEAARQHHERTMWQLLGFYLAVTGVLLQFWLDSDPFTEVSTMSNSFLVLFIPLFLGLFTASALLKHKFFWRKEMSRAVELEKHLGFRREAAYAESYYSHPIRYLRSGEMAMVAVLITVGGVGYLIGRSFWFKLPTAPFGLFWFPLYAAAIPFSLVAYGAYRKVMVNRERYRAGRGREIPERGSSGFRGFVADFVSRLIAGLVGSFLLGWSLQAAIVQSRMGMPFLDVWANELQLWASILLLSPVLLAAFRSLWREWKPAH